MRDLPRDMSIEDLAGAMDAAPLGIVVTDARAPDTPITYVNHEFTRITGYAADEVLGRNMRFLQGPASDPAEISRMRDAVAAGRAVTVQLTNYRKSGAPFPMRVEIRPVLGGDGQPRAFIGGLTDLSDQTAARQGLEESEERLRAVMAAIPLPMLTIRMDGIIARANTAAHEVLGTTDHNLVGTSIGDFMLPEAAEPAGPHLRGLLETQGAANRIEMRARKLNGDLLWVLVSAQRFTVRDETRVLAIFQDVTDLKRKERELLDANEEAERNIRARMRFLAAASHDLRQPLQAMALFASALDNHVSSPQARMIVQSLKQSMRGMEEMFDALLDMSKLDAGVMKSEVRDFLLSDVFEQLDMTYAAQAEAAGLDFRLVPSSLAVRSDPRLLARILGNFLSNAIRYTRKGKVLVGVRMKGGMARITVCDTGPGIPESQRLEIFREFRQGGAPAGAGRDAGMGLGLSIVQRMARLLSHPLGVRSVEGKGSGFSVDVPMVEGSRNAVAELPEDEDMREVSGATVVVVDDDREVQQGLTMLLSEWGCRGIIAASPQEALAALNADRLDPDIILADLHLRNNVSGISAIRDIRDRSGRMVPAFVLTGDTEAPADVGDGDIRVFRKPLDPLRLRTVMADALGRT